MSIAKGSLIAAADMSGFSSIPAGVIVMWSGASNAVPSGWVLCDGNNNTPNLVDRFIVGAGSTYAVGATGGSNTVTLTTAQMPSHTHTATLSLSGLTTSSAGAHTHSVNVTTPHGSGGWESVQGGDNWADTSNISGAAKSAGAHTHTISGSGSVTNSNTGSGSAHENRPPYYALCFIMKT